MKRAWIEYREAWQDSPMSYWVHVEADGKPYYEAESFDPPRPGPVPGRGYPRLFVECDGFTFEFSSLAELEECARVLARKALPSTSRACAVRSGGAGPNRHWLSRLPSHVKPWRYRQTAARYLAEAGEALERQLSRDRSRARSS